MIRVALLWHMHQPLYRDPVAGSYRLPWVRLHALKDYYGMARLLREFPDIHLTFNLVPSLVEQIQEYAAGKAQDPFWEMARTPAEALDHNGRRFVLRYFFQANHQTMIGRYPRYTDLLKKFRGFQWDPDRAFRAFTVAEFRDLQVLSQLVWMDEYFLNQEPLRTLAAKGRGYSREDQESICDLQASLIGQVLPAYREAMEAGQAELSTSPYYHPILPLICDTDIARESRSDVALPRQRFRYPQDAREQLERARRLHESTFGAPPIGLWPSEGSVSDEVALLAADTGFQWIASDEGVLGRSLGLRFVRDADGRLANPEFLYTGYRAGGGARRTPVGMVFRDHQLSDLIGFVYSQMPAEEAARDLIRRIHLAADRLTARGQDALVTIILDGENAWEYYPGNGREFLRAFYGGLQADAGIETLTVSEALARQEPATLSHLVPGSWINANFDVWIGDEEDNRSWDLLARARADFETASQSGLPPTQREAAFASILAAEGSDWNWWYGPEHHSENEPEFDELYRLHLSNVYQALGRTPPSQLFQTISHAAPRRVVYQPPTGWIHPRIDGEVTSYFEWLGAATYSSDRRTATMHGKRFSLAALVIGYDEKFIYVRVDLVAPDKELQGELRFELAGQREAHLVASIQNGELVKLSATEGELPAGCKMGFGRIVELRFPRAELGIDAHHASVQVRVAHWCHGLPHEILPQEGSIEIRLESKEALAEAI